MQMSLAPSMATAAGIDQHKVGHRDSRRAYGDGIKVPDRAQDAYFQYRCSPLLLEIPAFGERKKTRENRRFSQVGVRHLRSVTSSAALTEKVLWPILRRLFGDLSEFRHNFISEQSPPVCGVSHRIHKKTSPRLLRGHLQDIV